MTGHQVGNRKKRRVLNFVGQLSKVLVGTMDDNDAKYYNEQVNLFEQNSEDIIKTAVICGKVFARGGK
jgi:hypothetical protein